MCENLSSYFIKIILYKDPSQVYDTVFMFVASMTPVTRVVKNSIFHMVVFHPFLKKDIFTIIY